MATKKVVKKTPAKATKKRYAWAFDDGDAILVFKKKEAIAA